MCTQALPSIAFDWFDNVLLPSTFSSSVNCKANRSSRFVYPNLDDIDFWGNKNLDYQLVK